MACFTADKSSGEVAVLAAGAKGAAVLAGTAGFGEIGACNVGTDDGTLVGAAETGTASAAGASDSGALLEAADFCTAGFDAAALTGLLAGRCRGSGTGSDGEAACTCADTMPKTKTA